MTEQKTRIATEIELASRQGQLIITAMDRVNYSYSRLTEQRQNNEDTDYMSSRLSKNEKYMDGVIDTINELSYCRYRVIRDYQTGMLGLCVEISA